MDIEKDSNREAFESWFESRYGANFMQFALDLDMYVDKHTQTSWEAWQAAKAHEAEKLKGCVLVPVQCPDPDFADSLFDELSKKAIGEFGDDLLIHFSDIDEEKIWALMVEAAKAQAAPEGFILVDKHQLAQLMANMDSFGKKALGDDYVSFADIAEVLDEAREPAND